jgi:NADH dehydrogenase
MADELIVVFGGSGFIGRHLVRALAKRGKRVRVPMRRPHLGQDLRVLGDVGQIHLMQANVRFPDSVDRALEGASGVVNLVGVLAEKGPQNFFNLHAEGASVIAAHADKREIDRFVQISAIGADPRAKSRYARTKAEGEEAVRTANPGAVIVRPSIVFGAEDHFFNRFAEMATVAPALPLIGFGKTRFQPVFVGDVAAAIANALDQRSARGRVFELGGPNVYTFKHLLQFTLQTIERRRVLAPLPFFAAQPLGMILDALFRLTPFEPPLTGDQVEMLRRDNIVHEGMGTIADLGVTSLETIEAVVPSYLWRFRPYGQFRTRQAA